MNKVKLKVKLLEAEMTFKDLAKAMGITPQALYRKVGGGSRVHIDDVRKMTSILCLEDVDIKEIFLS